jgi:hypothetical protein
MEVGREGHTPRARPLGPRRPARLAELAQPDRTPPTEVLLTNTHLIGLLLGTEEDWPRTFETLLERVGPITWRGETYELPTGRITNEPFDLRSKPGYSLVIDRLAWWYELPRGWLKKVSLMDDVYLLNNPFTFQAMEKHSAYCAMMRLGLNVPDTWMLPHKLPPGGGTWATAAQERFPDVAAKYNLPFELDEIGERVGYPLFMKPFDGGMWVGVTRITSPQQLHEVYDASGQRLMHLQAAVEDFEVFTRTLTIGPESMTMKYRPDRPQHDRYEVAHDFLTPELGQEVVTISQLVNAFFRWEFNSCETLVKDGVAYPIDYANASPDVALTSLHYYFPWAITSLVRWSAFCAVTHRRMRINQNTRDYFEIGDRDDLSYEEKLREYRRLADEYHQVDDYRAFCEEALPHLDEIAHEHFASPAFGDLLVETVRSTFPVHEHEHFVAHYRGLLGAWVADRR